jgi:hypothetical protein
MSFQRMWQADFKLYLPNFELISTKAQTPQNTLCEEKSLLSTNTNALEISAALERSLKGISFVQVFCTISSTIYTDMLYVGIQQNEF